MWRLSHLIGDFEEPEVLKGDLSNLPVQPKASSGWTLRDNPFRYTRVFKFSDETKFNSFAMDILELQSETQHHARMTLQYPKIKIEVWTHTLNDVTEIDRDWCNKANDIFGDYQ